MDKSSESGKRSEASEGGFNRWLSRAEFGNLTYWNHDSLPSPDDPLIRCFHWFSVSNAVSALVKITSLFIFALIYAMISLCAASYSCSIDSTASAYRLFLFIPHSSVFVFSSTG